ncbi:MAG: transglutaminase family protein, partial [Erythrobacter sp.]|nr:transglutaminase family protein [Erythrobacter sp.]
MTISIHTRFAFSLDKATDVLLQFEAADIPEHEILSSSLDMTEAEHRAHVPAQDDIGTRIWIRAQGEFEVDYRAEVRPCRQLAKLETLQTLEPILPHDMPGEAVQYLFDSRYCPADKFQPFVEAEFGGTQGGARIAAIRDWIEKNFIYQSGVSDARTGALDSFVERRGICRDFA